MLAIWSDIPAEQETDYLHWLTREHTQERVSTEGFVAVRVFRADQTGLCRYFICYDLETAGVVGSAPYLAKLNNPTPWSQRIMPLLGNFRRGGGAVKAVGGSGEGGIVVPLILRRAPSDAAAMVGAIAGHDGIAAVRYLEVDGGQTDVQTREKSMRTGDQSFAGLLLVEGLRDDAVRSAIGQARSLLTSCSDESSSALLYRNVFSLHRDTLAAR